MIAVVWQFRASAGSLQEFEKFFGADGPWQALSRRSRSFLGSSFLRDAAHENVYLLIDYWSEMLVYERHQENFLDDIRELERQRDALLDSMVTLGVFNALDVPDRSGPTWSRRRGQEEPGRARREPR